MSSARTALRERVAALGRARRAFDAGRLDDAERILQDELARWPANRDAQALLAEVRRARGVTSGHEGPAPAAPRKGRAEAWSSFEQRIRERKAARLRDHIRASLEAGSPEAALDGLEELETVAPGVPLPEDIVERLRAQVPDAPAIHDPEPEPLARRSARLPTVPASGTPGYLREMSSAPSVVPETGLEREAPQPQPRPRTVTVPDSAQSGERTGTTSALDLFPAATEWQSPVVHTRTPFEELPLRERAHDPGPLAAGRARDLDDDSSLRLRLAPAGETKKERTAPLRERGAHLLGLLLVVSSILALSGWAGYRLFKPTTTVTEAPVPESDITEPTAAEKRETAQPASEPAASPSPTDNAETIGTAGGGSASPDPGTQLSAVPPATPPGVTPSTTAAAPPRAGATTSAPAEREGSAPSTSRETTTVERERVPPPSPSASGPGSAGVETEPAGQLPQVGGTASPPAPAVRSPQPTPEPVPPIAQQRSEPATTATTEPAAPTAAARESAGESTAPANVPADAATTAAAEAGTSTRDADAMRGLIEGYLAGYNNLDAGGVRGVWPTVDQRALSRAFGQLRSQHLSFSRCEVRTTGDTGHGFCTGHAAWRPRVGGGEKIEQRVWRFDFAQREDDWIIQKVNVER